MPDRKRIELDENFVVVFSEHTIWTKGFKMTEGLIRLAAKKGYCITIVKRGRDEEV